MAITKNANESKDVPNMDWIVQKFGGTSVGKYPDKIALHIVRENLQKHQVLVVCSAISTGSKAQGTTSRLLDIYSKLESWTNTLEFHVQNVVDSWGDQITIALMSIYNDHLRTADNFIHSPDLKDELAKTMLLECRALLEYIDLTKRLGYPTDSHTKDRIVGLGERLSCLFMTAMLQDKGIPARYVDMSSAVECRKSTRPCALYCEEFIATFESRLSDLRNGVPVVTGFFGHVSGGLIDGGIGRGYTDLCAALCARAVKAKQLQIWKEVDGVFTADPSKVSMARLLSEITTSEAAELAFHGSEVIHHLTLDQIRLSDPPISVCVKNCGNPCGHGTTIVADSHQHLAPSSERLCVLTDRRSPTAITMKENVSILNLQSDKHLSSNIVLTKAFAELAKHSVDVGLVSISEAYVSLAIQTREVQFEGPENVFQSLSEYGTIQLKSEMAIVCVVGNGLKSRPGIAGEILSTLGNHGINLEMISQGPSGNTISCVLASRHALQAMNVLHNHLFCTNLCNCG